jgi:hypothetical protein
MIDEMMTLRTLLEKSSDTDLLREMIGFTAQRLMELEVEGRTGAAWGDGKQTRSFLFIDDCTEATACLTRYRLRHCRQETGKDAYSWPSRRERTKL